MKDSEVCRFQSGRVSIDQKNMMEPETNTLLSDDVEDCFSDSNVLLSAEEMEREYLKVLEEDEEDGEDNALDEDCATDVESETPGVATIDESNDDENDNINEDNSCEESREINNTTETSCGKEEVRAVSKSRNGLPKPPKKFSPFRPNQHSSTSTINGGMPSKGSKHTTSFYHGATSSSSGETSDEGIVPKKVMVTQSHSINLSSEISPHRNGTSSQLLNRDPPCTFTHTGPF